MARRRRRRAPVRRLLTVLILCGVVVAIGLAVHQSMPGWYARLWYPLEYEAAVTRDAARNGVDPALVAAVAWRESGFDASAISHGGAVGVMQVLPSTARFIEAADDPPPGRAHDLSDPDVNISFGAWYLRYLLDAHQGSAPAALAAYNAGPETLRTWRAAAAARGADFRVPEDVPFAETRQYVVDVLDAWAIYREAYGDRLGRAPGG